MTAGREQVEEVLRRQLHFYFSPENLVKDFYLRGKMDKEGWVPFAEVAQFNRVRQLLGLLGIGGGGGEEGGREGGKAAMTDLSLLINIAADSEEVEVQMMTQDQGKGGREGGKGGRFVYKIRPRHEPLQWVLPPMEGREE